MNTFESILSRPLVESLGWTLVHFVWQGAAIAGLLALVLALLRRSSPNARYVAACAALALMAVSPAVTFSFVRPAPVASQPILLVPQTEPIIDMSDIAPQAAPIDQEIAVPPLPDFEPISIPASAPIVPPAPAFRSRVERLLPWCVAAWLLGVAALSTRLLAGWLTVQRIKRRATRPVSEPWVGALARLARQLRVSRPVRLLESALVEVPTVIGSLRPVILLPASAITGLTTDQLEALLAHELAHIRRHDYLVNLVQTVIETWLFYHPAVWWVSHRIRAEREACCDEMAIRVSGNRLAYARALAAMEEIRGTVPQLAVAASGGSLLLRIRRVLDQSESGSSRSAFWVVGTLVFVALFVFGTCAKITALASQRDEPVAPATDEERTESAKGVGSPAAENGTGVGNDARQNAPTAAQLSGRLFVTAALRTRENASRFFQSAIAIDPNTGGWSRLQMLNETGFSVPLSPVRVSPDGRTMLFMRETEKGQSELWRCDATTGEHAERLLEKGTPATWSPDGKRFVAVVPIKGGNYQEIENWIVSADGREHSVLALPDEDAVEDWSADGQWLVVVSRKSGQICLVKPDGSGRRRITAVADYDSFSDPRPRISPDGRRIVYLRVHRPGDEDARIATHSLRAINIDGTDDREILGDRKVESTSGATIVTSPLTARWSPDGKHLAVVLFDHMRDGGILALNGNWRLAIIDADGGNLRELKLEGVLNTVLPWDGPDWRAVERVARPESSKGVESAGLQGTTPVEDSGRATQAVDAQEAKQGTKLKPGTEEKLRWGEPVNGLRTALAWPPTLGEPAIGDEQEFFIVVQNVSDAAVRLTANDAAPNPRRLILRDSAGPVSAFADDSLMPGDWQLQPSEVAFIRLFQPAEKLADGSTLSAAKERAVRVFPQYSLTAEMRIKKAPAGAWTGKLATGESRGSLDVNPPKQKEAQAIFKSWDTAARVDGKIPGGVIGHLADGVTQFIEYNPTWETTPQLKKMLPRFDATRDWSRADAVALLDELATLQTSPISMAMDRDYERTIHTGTPLPPELAKSPWGEPLPNGLRLAWRLEPHALKHRLNTPLKSRVLLHNAGKEPVVFRTQTFQQVGHEATDAHDQELKVDSVYWTTLGRLLTYRLAPGEFIELNAPGIGVGARNKSNDDDWQNTRVGSWIDAKPNDVVTMTTAPVPLAAGNEDSPPDGPPQWWLELITARLSRHLPFPADADARRLLLYRVAIELFGNPVKDEINAAFVADHEPTALESLVKRLAQRSGVVPFTVTSFTGSLQSGPNTFLVLPPDPDAAKRPRVVNNPGWYSLGDHIRLSVTRRRRGERIVNEASIVFYSPDQKSDPPGEPVKLDLPDGYSTWAAAWLRDTTVLWVARKDLLQKCDFTNAANVEETRFEADQIATAPVPPEIREALRAALAVTGSTKQQHKLPPAADRK